MQHRPTSSSHRRVFTAALAIVGAVTVAWAEKIQFSKPVVAIATPPKAQLDLPDRKTRELDFSSPSQMDRPMPPPPVMRVPPREREEDDEDAGRHPLLRDPEKFPDAVGRAGARNPLAPSKSKVVAPRLSLGTVGSKARDAQHEQHALSPISDINLDLRDRDREQRRRDPAAMDNSLASDRNDPRKRDAYAMRDNAPEPIDFFNSASKFDPFTARPKEKEAPSAQDVERRVAFDQLINPGANMARAPGSLEPVTGLEASKPAVPAATPMLGGMKFELDSADPANGIKIQQERLRAPIAETLSKKYSQPTKPATAGAGESHFKTSLMRQPTVHEIPARKY